MQLSHQQRDRIARNQFVRKLEAAFARDLEDFRELAAADRARYVDEATLEAAEAGLRTEQGLGAYALALWFLGAEFTARSRYLPRLLRSDYPEVRKVHALNEWVHQTLVDEADPDRADRRLREAFEMTAAWGGPGGSQ